MNVCLALCDTSKILRRLHLDFWEIFRCVANGFRLISTQVFLVAEMLYWNLEKNRLKLVFYLANLLENCQFQTSLKSNWIYIWKFRL